MFKNDLPGLDRSYVNFLQSHLTVISTVICTKSVTNFRKTNDISETNGHSGIILTNL